MAGVTGRLWSEVAVASLNHLPSYSSPLFIRYLEREERDLEVKKKSSTHSDLVGLLSCIWPASSVSPQICLRPALRLGALGDSGKPESGKKQNGAPTTLWVPSLPGANMSLSLQRDLFFLVYLPSSTS